MKMTTCELLTSYGLPTTEHPEQVKITYTRYTLLVANKQGITTDKDIVKLIQEIAYTYMPHHKLIDELTNIHNPCIITISSKGIHMEYSTRSVKVVNIITSTGLRRGYKLFM